MHACVLVKKDLQMRVNEPTTFNSGLALCLFLSGLFNTKPFFLSAHLHEFSGINRQCKGNI